MGKCLQKFILSVFGTIYLFIAEARQMLKWADGNKVKSELDVQLVQLLGAKTAEELNPTKTPGKKKVSLEFRIFEEILALWFFNFCSRFRLALQPARRKMVLMNRQSQLEKSMMKVRVNFDSFLNCFKFLYFSFGRRTNDRRIDETESPFSQAW